MRARDTRKTLRELKALCRDHGLELSEVTKRGKGSHRSLLFRDPKTGEAVSLVIAGHEEISPGVQRGLLEYVRTLAGRIALGVAIVTFWRISSANSGFQHYPARRRPSADAEHFGLTRSRWPS